MNRHASRFVLSVSFLLSLPAVAAWGQTPGEQPASSESSPVAAVVNGEPISVAAMDANYAQIASQRGLSSKPADQTKAELLTQLVNRQLVIQALERDESLVTPEELEKEIGRAAAQIKKENGVSIEEYARMSNRTIESLRDEVYWHLAWNRYLDRHLADALEEYFDRHRKELDGTEVRASHILLRPEKYNETNVQIAARANRIRQEVESKKVTFEEAAAKYSAGPSREKGGDLGFIPRHGLMAPDFASAAFKLEQGEISEPVNTAFGTHLIRVTEIKPGSRQWTEVIPQIRVLASADLFDNIAGRETKNAKIEYTGITPYIDPDTEKLVVPATAEPAATK